MKTRRSRSGLEPEARAARWVRRPAVEGDDPGNRVGHREADAVGRGGAFAEADQVDPFGVDVELAAGMGHRGEQVLIHAWVFTPGESRPAGGAAAEATGPRGQAAM